MDGLVRSINHVKSALRSISFNGRDNEPMMIRFGSLKMRFKASLSFEGRELDTKISLKSLPSDNENNVRVESENQRHNAALRLQKVYKSFRTRRQLADCAVLVEQRWWKVLDFAELKRTSVSFFEEKPQTAFSRWSRARTRAAKVGKGLSKDVKARKLALQHWLEAIDPRHRYGHNLHFYYVTWLQCNSQQPFFYWLDVGDGREVSLERCPRSKLQQQCIKYLGPTERRAYEVIVEDGKLVYKESGQVIDTTGEPRDVKWIFVLSTSRTLYVGKKNKGIFQHSSFLAGGATLSAGRLEVENGIIKAIWPHSGHYLPTEENFQEFTLFLCQHNVDLTDVKQNPYEESELSGILQSEYESSSRGSENVGEEKATRNRQKLPSIITKLRTITKLKPRARGNVMDSLKCDGLPSPDSPLPCYYYFSDDDDDDEDDEEDEGYETAEDESSLSDEDFMFRKQNLFDEDQEDEKHIPKEKILQRIDSHNAQKSYQLAHQLSSKWTTGAGPRIGCMKDYPSELRFRILEHLVSKTKRNQME